MMKQSPFIRHFPLAFKICTNLDLNSKKFNNYLLFFRFFSHSFLFLSTTSCSFESSRGHDFFSKSHDLFMILMYLFIDILFVTNKASVCKLVKSLLEPFEEYEPDTIHSKITKDYDREVNLFGQVATTVILLGAIFWSTAPLLFNIDTTGDQRCVHATLGWVWKSKNYYYTLLTYASLTVVCLATVAYVAFFYVNIVFIIIKIKYKIRLLCADFHNINIILDRSIERPGYNTSTMRSGLFEQEVVICPVPLVSTSLGKESGRLQFTGTSIPNIGVELKESHSEEIIREHLKVFLPKVVEKHINIIREVKLVDRTFRTSVLILVQLGVLIVALAIPKINLSEKIQIADFVHRGFEAWLMLVFIAALNYCGQIVLDESEKLRQALYSCDWTDKPLSFKRGLLIMQTVATRTLKLTIGGMYVLSMETYSNVIRATYSYISLIQTTNLGQ